MPAYDPNTGNPGEATALDSPSVALADQYRRNQQMQAAALAKQQAQEALTEARTAKQDQQNDRVAATQTATGDAAQWASTPQFRGMDWAASPDYVKQSFQDRYATTPGGGTGIAADLPKIWNQAQTNETQRPVGLNLNPGETGQVDVNGNRVAVGKLPPDQGARLLRTQAARMGITPDPDATPEEIQDQMAQAAGKQQTAKEQAAQQAQEAKNGMVIDRTKRMVQNSPQVKYYQGAKANYDSIAQNLAKPNRTGADDAFLVQAAATMEAPGRSPTGHDVQQFLAARGIQGNLDVIGGKIQALLNSGDPAQRAKAGRIFDDQTAKDIAEAAQRSLQTRRESLTESMAPHVFRLEDIGEDPYRHLPKSLVDDVYGVSQESAQPSAAPTPQDQKAIQWIKANPNDPFAATLQGILQRKGVNSNGP